MSVLRIVVTFWTSMLTTLVMMAMVMLATMMIVMAAENNGEDQTTASPRDWIQPINDSVTWLQQPDEPVFFSEEQELMHALVGQYENSVRPVYDANDAVDVSLGLTLTQILDLDEKNQVLTTNVWLEATWYDQRLGWNSSDFGGIRSIRIPCDRIWLPDIVLYNSVDDYTSGYMPSLAMVYNDSKVFWGPVIRFRSSCKIDITYFPFDDQVCSLKLGSWAYNGFQVNVWNSSDTMDLSNLVDNGEWELVGVKVERNVVFYNCCDEPFPDVTFFVHLRRRVKYYFMNIIIPCIILSFLCLAGFLLPPESGEKITLGLSVLLTITVFMLMVADKMPQTSESISVISIYLMVVLATSCLSVLSSVCVLSIHHQRGQPRPVPSWLRFLVFSVIARVVCVSTATSYRRSSASASASTSSSSACAASGGGGGGGGGGKKNARDKGSRKKERKVSRSPRRSRVATEEREYLRMEHRTTPFSSKRDPTHHHHHHHPNTTPPPTQPLLPQPFTISTQDSPYPSSSSSSPSSSSAVPAAEEGRSWCSVCAGTGVVLLRGMSSRRDASGSGGGGGGGGADTSGFFFDPRKEEGEGGAEGVYRDHDVTSPTGKPLPSQKPGGRHHHASQEHPPKPCSAPVDASRGEPTSPFSSSSSSFHTSERPAVGAAQQTAHSISSTETLYARESFRHLHGPSDSSSPAKKTSRENSQNDSTTTLEKSSPKEKEEEEEEEEEEGGVWKRRKDRPEEEEEEEEESTQETPLTFTSATNKSHSPRRTRAFPANSKHTTTTTTTATTTTTTSTPTTQPSRHHPTSRQGEERGHTNTTTTTTRNFNATRLSQHHPHHYHYNPTATTTTTQQPTTTTLPPNHPCCQCWHTSTSSMTTNSVSSASKDKAIIQRLMSMIQSKHGEEVKDEELYREWHDVACVLDRLLFYVFLIITVVSSAVVLEMRPNDVRF
ncbi:uncharacterized protein LOC143278035 [Babylonia areolata]|uniref:uncharacterized protein LOC143278035 n=1 Tax=Babylonia areolata TaxID=304850 RepID=UPI003FD20C7A